MKRAELNYDWPPKPIDDKTSNRNRKRVFKGLRDYLRQRSPHEDIRKYLSHATKDNLELIMRPEYDYVGPVQEVDVADIFKEEGLDDDHIKEITSQLWNVNFEYRLVLNGHNRVVQNDVCQLVHFAPTIHIPLETSTEVINGLHKNTRLRVAQACVMSCIEQKEGFFHLWDADTDEEVRKKFEGAPDDVPVIQGAGIKTITKKEADHDRGEESPWQTLYEYEILRRFYLDTVNGNLEVPVGSLSYMSEEDVEIDVEFDDEGWD